MYSITTYVTVDKKVDVVHYRNMKTIPLEPVFNNVKFQALKPAMQFYLLNALYKLCKEDKVSDPLPRSLNYLLECSTASYLRNKDAFYAILSEVLPQIAEIKLFYYKKVSKAHLANVKKGIIQREAKGEKLTFSDKDTIHTKITPISSKGKPYHTGQFDPIAVKNAKSNNASGEQKLFTDD